MKFTKSQLKQVILEVLNEQWTGADTSAKNYQDKAETRLLPRVKKAFDPVAARILDKVLEGTSERLIGSIARRLSAKEVFGGKDEVSIIEDTINGVYVGGYAAEGAPTAGEILRGEDYDVEALAYRIERAAYPVDAPTDIERDSVSGIERRRALKYK